MKRIEATTLEDAYKEAAKEFGCSITDINYEIVQYPTSGVMGLFKKTAIIIAVRKISIEENLPKEEIKSQQNLVDNSIKEEESVVSTIEEKSKNINNKLLQEEPNKVLDSFFDNKKGENSSTKFDDDRNSPKNIALSKEIEKKIINLMKTSCFDIDTIEVDVFNNIAHIFIDGEDAALLIGKEGYRYNALSYMLFNWINAHYDLYIKLEIAEFIQSQEEMIVNYLKPIIEHVNENGRGKTKPLDGILVQIALEQLRAIFPNKYVAIKTAKDNRKFIIINNFNNSKNG
ncbi:MAG: Jag N-terminal domain-containing protein [Sulfurovaceae bacterium]|nr:Jag N-terminal domain-containing protein [Sulfurovaceae bacterium]